MDFFAAREHPKGFAWDMTSDGAFTISDVKAWLLLGWDWFVWVFFLPGDFLISLFLEGGSLEGIGRFFEMSADWNAGWISGIGSAASWLILIAFVWQLLVEPVLDAVKWVQKKLRRSR